jgi:hypothetical protein
MDVPPVLLENTKSLNENNHGFKVSLTVLQDGIHGSRVGFHRSRVSSMASR